MANVFETVITYMVDSGIYNLLIFAFVLGVLFTILKRIKIFGESTLVNGTISFAIAFMVFGYPVIIGYSLVTPFVSMFAQATVVMLVLGIALLITNFFYPDLSKFLTSRFTSRGVLEAAIVIAVIIALTSGAANVMINSPKGDAGAPSIPTDLVIMAGIVIILIIVLLIASTNSGKGS
ncbi:MAG: hypothetical protein NT016_02695 [Candidatus Aenigmarchaeota archaeon]|nr:hypothetical protein [Candidatus Aenigmarchaeota archaeon]